ncbi:FtsX-like permease family protein [Gordonia sp. (in: high G+C Gram-positive bacteria)]|uniref:FtsX-like permease family protein n=1 Tax=Gordonia sp. (in: high G+C Gram-positive bacteria) TaxID=84139 RepID=UPI003BB4F9B5
MVVVGVDQGLPSMLDSDSLRSVAASHPLAPGMAYMSREWATRSGFKVGDKVEVNAPGGVVTWEVAALLDSDFANHGAAIVVPAAAVEVAFDRGASTDVLLLRGDTAQISARIVSLVDGAAQVTSPDSIFASYNRIFRTPLMLVSLFAAIAVLTGAVVVFLTWRLALGEARPTLSRLRLLGARTGDLVVGSGLVLVPILLVTYVVGAAIGVVLGRELSSFRQQITNFTGQAFEQPVNYALPLSGAFIAAVAMFAFAWLTGVFQLRAVAPIDAISGRDETVIRPSAIRWPLLGGATSLIASAIIVRMNPGPVLGLAVILLFIGLALLAAVLPVLAGTALRTASSGASGLMIGRQLEVEWRRNAALAITFAVALLTSITMSGTADSMRSDIDAAVQRLTGGQLYVVAAPVGSNFGSETFGPQVRDEIAAVAGVAATDTFAYTNVTINGGRYRVESLGGDVARFTDIHFDSAPDGGVERDDLNEMLHGNNVAISSNFARTQKLKVGSTVDIPVADGHQSARVVAVIDDSTSDGGMIVLGSDLYRQVAGTSWIYAIGLVLTPGVDVTDMTGNLSNIVKTRYPRAEVVSAEQYRSSLGSNLSRLMSSFIVFAWVMYVVAAVVGAATLSSSIAIRARGISLTRLIGGDRNSLRKLLGAEALITVVIAWAVAVAGAAVGTRALIGVQSIASGLLPPIRTPYSMVMGSLPLAVFAAAAAVTVARRSLGHRPLAETLADE